jgi:hypothetical protein
VEQGCERLASARPIAERHGLTPLQLACLWNLAHEPVECVVPTLIEEADAIKPVEAKRAELSSLPAGNPLSSDEVAAIRAIGDNAGCMRLKGASPDNDGEQLPDSWPLSAELAAVAERWTIEPTRQLAYLMD